MWSLRQFGQQLAQLVHVELGIHWHCPYREALVVSCGDRASNRERLPPLGGDLLYQPLPVCCVSYALCPVHRRGVYPAQIHGQPRKASTFQVAVGKRPGFRGTRVSVGFR